MNPREPKRSESEAATLTPRARRELAAHALLAAIDQYVRTICDGLDAASEWVDQHHSPLGKRAHLEAVRGGVVPGVKHGKRVLVRRAELNSYLARHSVKHRPATNNSDEEIDGARASEVAAAVLTHVGLRQRKG